MRDSAGGPLSAGPRCYRLWTALAVGTVMAMAVAAGSATAQGQDIAFGKRLYQDKASCGFCHGWSGDGAGDPHSPGAAANIRRTAMDREMLVEVIRCGRPNSAMPHFDKFAWTKGEDCFGMTAEDVGEAKPPVPTAGLQKREIDAIVDYLVAKIVGKGDPTWEDCVDYYGGMAPRCEQMKAGTRR